MVAESKTVSGMVLAKAHRCRVVTPSNRFSGNSLVTIKDPTFDGGPD